MRTALLLVVALALVLSASAVWAASGINRGTQSWLTTYSEANGGPGTWSGIYNGVGDGKGWYNQIVTGNQANLTVAADVELFCSQTWENTGVYFHKADATNPPPVVLPGTMTSNHGEWIGLVADAPVGAGIFNLERKYDYRLNLVTKGDFNIPLVWEMRDSVGSGWSPWKAPEAIDTAGADGTIPTAVWWLLGNNTPGSSGGQAGAYQYEFQCTAQMSQLQQDGRYELDPAVVVSPEL